MKFMRKSVTESASGVNSVGRFIYNNGAPGGQPQWEDVDYRDYLQPMEAAQQGVYQETTQQTLDLTYAVPDATTYGTIYPMVNGTPATAPVFAAQPQAALAQPQAYQPAAPQVMPSLEPLQRELATLEKKQYEGMTGAEFDRMEALKQELQHIGSPEARAQTFFPNAPAATTAYAAPAAAASQVVGSAFESADPRLNQFPVWGVDPVRVGEVFRYAESPDQLHEMQNINGTLTGFSISLEDALEDQKYKAAQATATSPDYLQNPDNWTDRVDGNEADPVSELLGLDQSRAGVDYQTLTDEAAGYVGMRETTFNEVYDKIGHWTGLSVNQMAESAAAEYGRPVDEARRVAQTIFNNADELDQYGILDFDLLNPFSKTTTRLSKAPGINKAAEWVHYLNTGSTQGAPNLQKQFEDYYFSPVDAHSDRAVFNYSTDRADKIGDMAENGLYNTFLGFKGQGERAAEDLRDIATDRTLSTDERLQAVQDVHAQYAERFAEKFDVVHRQRNSEIGFPSFVKGSNAKVVYKYDPGSGNYDWVVRDGMFGLDMFKGEMPASKRHIDEAIAYAAAQGIDLGTMQAELRRGGIASEQELAAGAALSGLGREVTVAGAAEARLDAALAGLPGPQKTIIRQQVVQEMAQIVQSGPQLKGFPTVDSYMNYLIGQGVDASPTGYVEHGDTTPTRQLDAYGNVLSLNVYHGNLAALRNLPPQQRAAALKSQYLRFNPDNPADPTERSEHSAMFYVARTLYRNGFAPNANNLDNAINGGQYKNVNQIPALHGVAALNTAPGSTPQNSMLRPDVLDPNEKILECAPFTEDLGNGVKMHYQIYLRENCANPIIVATPEFTQNSPVTRHIKDIITQSAPQISDAMVKTEGAVNLAYIVTKVLMQVGMPTGGGGPTGGPGAKDLNVIGGGGGGTVVVNNPIFNI